MRSAKSILARGLCINSEMRQSGIAVSTETARRLFDSIEEESPLRSTSVADFERNKELNRWYNVLPFDETRVKLNNSSQNDFNDYINASRVDSLENKSYILTQGPLPKTIGHFWTMVWQQSVSAIVMLCRLNENGICKCAPYWPQTVEEDDLINISGVGLEVRLRDFDDEKDFLVRNLELRHCETDSIRVISHYHYLTWPDFGVPSSTSTFLNFLHTVNSKHPSESDSPNIVHCSAGIGRSGTFILADTCLEHMKRSKIAMKRSQILDTLLRMRSMRGGLIQTHDQLKFCLQAIEDGMANIEFDPETTEEVSSNRKRSTDSTNEVDETALKRLSDNETAAKRPKANC